MTYPRIQSSLQSIDADAKALSDTLAALNTALATAQADSTAKATEITALKDEIINLKAQIAALTPPPVTPPATPTRLFTTQVPAQPNRSDGVTTDWEQGMRFSTNSQGEIRGIRYFKAVGESGSHTGRIWSPSGTLLVSVAFANETASGWQEQALPTPLAITAGVTYTVSVNARSHYAMTPNGFSAPISNGGLTAPVSAGVYNDVQGAFPALSWENANYFRDVVFVPTGPAVSPPPVTPPPAVANFGIPISGWNDLSFVNMTERTSPVTVGANQTVSGLSIDVRGQTGAPAAIDIGSTGSMRRCRIRANEGIRVSDGARLIEGCFVEVTATSTHSDSLQAYNPGATGTITLRNSWLCNIPGTHEAGNAAYWSAADWRGNHILENVLLSGGGFNLRIPGDGGTSMSLTNVFFEEGTGVLGTLWFPEVNGRRCRIDKWENVRFARIVNGSLVLGAFIPKPY